MSKLSIIRHLLKARERKCRLYFNPCRLH